MFMDLLTIPAYLQSVMGTSYLDPSQVVKPTKPGMTKKQYGVMLSNRKKNRCKKNHSGKAKGR